MTLHKHNQRPTRPALSAARLLQVPFLNVAGGDNDGANNNFLIYTPYVQGKFNFFASLLDESNFTDLGGHVQTCCHHHAPCNEATSRYSVTEAQVQAIEGDAGRIGYRIRNIHLPLSV